MKSNDRARLTSALRDHVASISADLRAQMRATGPSRARAEQLHKDERIAEDFEVWTDLLSRRTAVLWVLKSVYVRVLEDLGLLSPGRLLDPESQQLFERLAPNLGETAFLRWIYRDLASPRGGLPELFSPQPAEVALPSDELSRSLITFWRHRDADTGAAWSFKEERFEGELMGDLYQELDPVVKERFALCQTPDFVRAFILDRTLTPAAEKFGADEVRLIDPACGSGHFLIDALKRIVSMTAQKHPDWDRPKLVTHALERVVGIDLNDYACALARTRLIMTASELAGVTRLADAARFHPHVYWADGLEQVEQDKQEPTVQYALFDKTEEAPRATLSRSDVRAALRKVLASKFSAVVANPPYIVENDEARKAYHREKVGKGQRYASAFRIYSLGAPFTERAFQLAQPGGFVGLITADGFMKRVYGRPLVEQCLRRLDLTLLVDTSKAEVRQRDCTTVLIFGRNQRPASKTILAVMGRRGETQPPTDPSRGQVWSSIVDHWNEVGFENDFITVAQLPRESFDRHPWSLTGGGAAQVLDRIEKGTARLGSRIVDMGRTMHTGLDDAFFVPQSLTKRWETERALPLVRGEGVRDWSIRPSEMIVFPYMHDTLEPIAEADSALMRHLWRTKPLLTARTDYGKGMEERGHRWFEWSMFFKERLGSKRAIAFPVQATHNHFAQLTSRAVFNSKAPLIIFDDTVTDTEFFAILGTLNSSVMAFWMRQKFQPRGGQSTGKKRQSEEWSRRLELDATKLKRAPLAESQAARIADISQRLAILAGESARHQPGVVLTASRSPSALREALRKASTRLRAIRNEMVALQEELDWTLYGAFRIPGTEELELPRLDSLEPLASEHRPFALRLAKLGKERGSDSFWFASMGVTPATDVPDTYASATRTLIQRRLKLLESHDDLSILESPEFKRKWEPLAFEADLQSACLEWLESRVESAIQGRPQGASIAHLVAAVQDDPSFLEVASLYQDRRDVDLTGLILQIVEDSTAPSHPFHTYTESGLAKREAWEQMWAWQRRRDRGETLPAPAVPSEYSQGSRGKSTDFLRHEYWQLRGKLDVPHERFIAFTEVPGREGVETILGWAGWTPLQRLKAILTIDENLEDSGVPLASRIGLLDSAWRLLPDVLREDPSAATRLKAELQALVGQDGPSRELIEDWRRNFPAPTAKGSRTKRARPARADDDSSDSEEVDES